MHKLDLAAKLAKKTALDERAALAYLNLMLSEISGSLKKGQRVTLTGFGTFELRKKKKRTMTNNITGKPMTVPAHKAVGFIPGQPLKWSVR